MTYDELLIEAGNAGLLVKEKPLKFYDGRIKGRKIAIRQNIPTLTEKACVLAEEMGHYCTNTMDILDQKQVINRKLGSDRELEKLFLEFLRERAG